MAHSLYSSRIANEAVAWQEAEDTNVTGWIKTNEIVLATGLESNTHNGWTATVTLQWENTTDSIGVWNDLSNTGEIRYTANPNYADGDVILHGDEGLTPIEAAHIDGRKNESRGSWVDFSIAKYDHQELLWAITLDNALDGKQYSFRIFDGSDPFAAAAQITTAAPAVDPEVDEAESISFTDSPASGFSMAPSTVSDTVTVTDSPTIFIGSGFGVSASESITVGDSPSITFGIGISASESITVADTVSINQVHTWTASESVTVADSPTISVSGAGVNVDESETITITDSPAISIEQVHSWTASDAIAVADSTSLLMSILSISGLESITVADSPTISVSSGGYSINESESIGISESIALNMDMEWSASDSLSITDDLSVLMGVGVSWSASEAISLSEYTRGMFPDDVHSLILKRLDDIEKKVDTNTALILMG